MNVLFLGDIYGKAGRKLIVETLPALKQEYEIDLCIANCENLSYGRGVTKKSINQMTTCGVDVFTSGNHLFDKKDSLGFIEDSTNILKPANYPKGALGKSFYVFEDSNFQKCAVVCLVGQVFMNVPSINTPFFVMECLLEKQLRGVENIFVDFHAETTAEKRAFAEYFDGRLAAVVGTHTHIQTADEQILAGGTAFITDVGMNGPHDSVIGVKKEIILKKLQTGMPQRFIPAKSGLQLNCVVVRIKQGGATSIKRILKKYD